MKKNIIVNPTGLKGNQINERMMELMGISNINENKSKIVVELTKVGPDGKAYAIVRENHEWYVKSAENKKGLVAEDFKYIGGLQNKKSEAYPSYAKAIKHLNLKFKSLAEAHNYVGEINLFLNDNLLSESGVAGFSATHGGFTGEGNLEENLSEAAKNNPWAICTSSVGREDKEKYEACVKDIKKQKGIDENTEECDYNMTEEVEEEEIELTTEEAAVEAMKESEETNEESEKPAEPLNEHKLSILRALEKMDSIIDNLTEGKVKKKVYTIK